MRTSRRLMLPLWALALILVTPARAGEVQADPVQQEDFVLPESYVSRIQRESPYLELSLTDAIRLALTNNLEIAIEDFNEDLSRERIQATKGFYDPVLNVTFGWNSAEFPTTSILQAGTGIPTNISRRLTLNSSLRQNVLGGGELTFNFSNDRAATNSIFSFVNPTFSSGFDLSFSQPLLRGFRQTLTERQLKIFNLDLQISDSQFQQRVAQIVEQVQNQYWELVFAIENYEAQRQSMGLAMIQYENNQKRVEIGVTAPIEITASRAEVAGREQEMIQSEVRIINSQNGLKHLLAPDPRASIWNLTLIPTDQPQMRELQITLDEAIDTALERRPELEELAFQMDKIEVDRSFYLKDGKPAVNLVANLGAVGRAGQVFRQTGGGTGPGGIPEPVGRVPDPDHPLFGNFGSSVRQAFGFDFINYGVGVNVQIPLRNRENDATMAQLAISERQLLSRFRNQQQLIMVDVRNAFEGILTQRKRLEAARVARQLSEEKLEGENKRFQAGFSTNFEVLSFQRDLANARVLELRALVDYQLALTALEKAMYTIVDGSDIILAREQNNNR